MKRGKVYVSCSVWAGLIGEIYEDMKAYYTIVICSCGQHALR